MSAIESPVLAAMAVGAAAGTGPIPAAGAGGRAWFEADVAIEMGDLSARFDQLRNGLAAAFDDADLAVQRRHKAAVDRLATIDKGDLGVAR